MYIYHENYSEAPYYLENFYEPIKWFGPLSHLNIFIGPNNCGKSRFLRLFMHEISNKKNLTICENSNIMQKAIELINLTLELKKLITSQINLTSMLSGIRLTQLGRPTASNTLKNDGNGLFITPEFLDELYKALLQFLTTKIVKNNTFFIKRETKFFFNLVIKHIVDGIQDVTLYNISILFKKIQEFCASISDYNFSTSLKNIHYVTIPRSLQRYKNSDDEYINGNFIEFTFNQKFSLSSEKIILHTGTTLYDKIKHLRNGKKDERRKFDKFEKYLKDNFFPDNSEIDIVARLTANENDNYIDIYIDGRNHPIYELGDGIQASIIVLFPFFICEKGDYIFIEEPETNLHPYFQRILIQKINELAKKMNLKVIMTTQSNHFLDLSSEVDEEISIFTFEKKKDNKTYFLINNVVNKDRNILRLLGANNASVFMANCCIWVEGVSDRIYIQKYLDAFYNSDEFKEMKSPRFVVDINYSFFEYAGLNLTHYLFENSPDEEDKLDKIKAQFIANKIFLVSDRDKGKDKKHENYEKLNNEYFQYYPLRCIEIENLMSKDQLVKILENFDATKINANTTKFYRDDYKKIGLGKFLDKVFKLNVFSAESGTLISYYKKRFYEIFQTLDIDWRKMSEDTKDLIRNLYGFISKHNL